MSNETAKETVYLLFIAGVPAAVFCYSRFLFDEHDAVINN